MEQEKINKIVELSKKKEALETLLNKINKDDVCLLVDKKGAGYNSDYLNTLESCAAIPYLEELHKRFVAMVFVDITDIETELESL